MCGVHWRKYFSRYACMLKTTGAVPSMKPEAIAIGKIARWPLEITLTVDGHRF